MTTTAMETRRFPVEALRFETRADGVRFVTGRAIAFNSWSVDLGGFRERVAPSFVDRTLASGSKVLVLWGHDLGDPLGNTKHPEGGASIEKRADGLYFRLAAENLSAKQRAALERKDVEGMSFRFHTLKDEWRTVAGGLDERTLIDGEFSEISFVTAPAYLDTTVALRSRDRSRTSPEPKTIAQLRAELDAIDLDPDLTPRAPKPERAVPASAVSRATYLQARGRSGDTGRVLAYHEAGHAVAHVVRGGGVAGLTLDIAQGRITGGGCHPTRASDPVTLMAGPAAEIEHSGSSAINWRASDFTRTYRTAHIPPGLRDGQSERIEWAAAQNAMRPARALVRRHWPAVRALAEALFEGGSLSGSEAERIIRANLDRPSDRIPRPRVTAPDRHYRAHDVVVPGGPQRARGWDWI